LELELKLGMGRAQARPAGSGFKKISQEPDRACFLTYLVKAQAQARFYKIIIQDPEP
jgi:hypothetical protein